MSPIYGLTDGTPTFAEIGRIRKGGEKGENRPGKNLDYFRVVFREDEVDAATAFVSAYGTEPTSINVFLAFDEIDQVLSAWWSCYIKGGLLGRADGRTWNYLRDPKTQEVLIKGSKLTDLGIERNIKLGFNPDEPVYSWHSKRLNKDVGVFPKVEVRLSVMIPELHRFAYLLVVSSSKSDAATLSSELAGIKVLAERMGLKMSEVPLVLIRRWDTISKPVGDGRGMVKESLLHLEFAPRFADLAIPYLERKTFAALSQPVAPEPTPTELLLSGDEEEEEILPDQDDTINPGSLFQPMLLPNPEDDKMMDHQPQENPAPQSDSSEESEEPAWWEELPSVPMAVAMSTKAQSGLPYGQMPDDELAFLATGLADHLNQGDTGNGEKRSAYLFRYAAIQTVLEERENRRRRSEAQKQLDI